MQSTDWFSHRSSSQHFIAARKKTPKRSNKGFLTIHRRHSRHSWMTLLFPLAQLPIENQSKMTNGWWTVMCVHLIDDYLHSSVWCSRRCVEVEKMNRLSLIKEKHIWKGTLFVLISSSIKITRRNWMKKRDCGAKRLTTREWQNGNFYGSRWEPFEITLLENWVNHVIHYSGRLSVWSHKRA